MKHHHTPAERHWSYGATWLGILCLPFLLTFGYGVSPLCCLIWLFLVLF